MFQHHRPHPHVHVLRFRGSRPVRHVVWGGALIVVGLAHLLRSQGVLSTHELWLIAPALLAWSGVVRVAIERNASAVVHATIRFALAAYLVIVIEQVGGWSFAATWPILLIAVGVANVAHALFVRASFGRGDAAEEPNW
jgi:hypothetical protein